ncbi:MAG TPA: methyltransferase domain-containing protein [Bryobacteraceae bacterium]|nr:methyltransferase domain-containing protein [Bryobacteraceae bacterium]
MSEFTGERVIPGQVNADLWAEHLARYAFAARLAAGRRVLDVGCGTGYGSAELAHRAARVAGLDNSAEALAYARANFALSNIEFLEGSATALPFADGSVDMVVAFEVIEHLEDWRGLLTEVKRVLASGGLFVVSTPNTRYYGESRGSAGPNPFHAHEFEFEEFANELRAVFSNVMLLAQNRTECFAFEGWPETGSAEVRVDGDAGKPEDAHFFIALCGAPPRTGSFIYVPTATNLLRERERHVTLLQGQLEEVRAERQKLIEVTDRQKGEIEDRNRWALELDASHKQALRRIVQLQDELQAQQTAGQRMAENYEAKIAELEQETERRADWARDLETRLTAEITRESAELAKCVELLDRAEATMKERTEWALDLEKQLQHLQAVRASYWVKIGKRLGLGPKL